jgi:hypothetical protein
VTVKPELELELEQELELANRREWIMCYDVICDVVWWSGVVIMMWLVLILGVLRIC